MRRLTRVLAKTIGLLLCTTPFVIGWLLFHFLNPVDFWESFATSIVIFIICSLEGIFAWIIGVSLLFTE